LENLSLKLLKIPFLDLMCGEPISLETEEEILAWKFWISGLLSLITG